MSHPRIVIAVAFFALALITAPAKAQTFTTWTSVDLASNAATGNIGTVGVNMTGTDLNFFQDDSTAFNAGFCPSLVTADLVEFVSSTTTNTYTIQFSRAVHNPIIHLRSLGSRLTFAGASLTKLCGQAGFVVSGNQVFASDCNGGGPPPIDSDENGTIRVEGWHTSLTFTAFYDKTQPGCSGAANVDGVDLQIGLTDPIEVPSMSRPIALLATLLTGLAGTAFLLRSRRPRAPSACLSRSGRR